MSGFGEQINRIIAISVVACSIFGPQVARSSGETESWRHSGLHFSKAERLLTSKRCLSNLKNFALCMESVQMILNASGSALELKSQEAWATCLGPIIEDWGLIKICRRINPTLPTSAAERVREKQQRAKQWVHLYNDLKKSSLPWNSEFWLSRINGLTPERTLEDLLLWVQLDIVNIENEASLTAKVINLFLSHSTDPYAHLYPKQQFRSEVRSEDEEYVGLGVVFRRWGDHIIVDQVDAGSPAGRAGITTGDFLLRVNQNTIVPSNMQASLEALKGAPGTRVELEIFHQRGTQIYSLTREVIRVPNVQYELREHGDVRTAVIRVASFLKSQTCGKIRKYVELARTESADGIILDLRGNPGGLVSQGVCTAGLFLPENLKVVVSRSTEKASAQRTPASKAKPNETSEENFFSRQSVDTQTALILLVDEDSASSSEIVAGALQDHGRALVVGTRTYGKGTFQRGHAFDSDGNILLFKTIAKFELPSGRLNQLVGLDPDIVVGENPKSRFSFELSVSRAFADAKKNFFLWTNNSHALENLKNCKDSDFFRNRLAWIRPDNIEALAEAHLVCHSRHFNSNSRDLRVARVYSSP